MSPISTIILLLILSIAGLNADTRIVGGADAPEAIAPYQVSMRVPYHKCGGSILNSWWIMTAAHCINPNDPMDIVKVRVGTNSLSRGGEEYGIQQIVVHPDNEGLLNDIALMKVSEEIKFNEKVRPISLPDKDTEGGANVMITGWGYFDAKNNRLPDKLQALNVTALSFDECAQKNRNIRKSELCTEGGKGKGVCMGDSGSPLAEENAVVGIASFILNGCGFGLPDGFTRVFYYKDWIQSIIN